MSDLLLGMLTCWAMVTVCVCMIGFVKYMDARGPVPRRDGARLMFGAPLWPVFGAVVAARNFRQAWRDADWKGMKR